MKYSGKTTAYEHKGDKDWTKIPNAGKECIRQETVLEVQWSNCPIEVEEEVKQLWLNNNLGNNHCYFKWDSEIHNNNPSYPHSYPIIDEYLKSKGITQCLIHWWW